MALLYRAKEGKKPSLSNQTVFASFPLKVAWSGISLIRHDTLVSLPTLRNLASRKSPFCNVFYKISLMQNLSREMAMENQENVRGGGGGEGGIAVEPSFSYLHKLDHRA